MLHKYYMIDSDEIILEGVASEIKLITYWKENIDV